MEGDTDAAAHKKTEEEERPEETKETEQLCQQMFGKMGAYLTSEMTGEKSLLPLSLSLLHTHRERESSFLLFLCGCNGCNGHY